MATLPPGKACAIFVGGIPKTATEADVAAHFEGYAADIESVAVPQDEKRQQGRGFAVVRFKAFPPLVKALRGLDGCPMAALGVTPQLRLSDDDTALALRRKPKEATGAPVGSAGGAAAAAAGGEAPQPAAPAALVNAKQRALAMLPRAVKRPRPT